MIALLITIIGVSYAFATLNLQGTRKQIITAGNLSLVLDEDENNLTLEEQLPMYDEVGMLQDAFTFRLINNSTVATNYKIKLVDITAEGVEKLDTSLVRYGLTKNGEDFIGTLSELTDGVIDSGQTPLETIEYELRFWIVNTTKDETLISGKSLSYRIDVEVEQINKDYYEFVFHPNGGVGEDITVICPYGQECDLTNIPFTKENYTLVGWATSIDGELVYNADLTLEDIDINPGDSLDLYAVWEPLYHTFVFHANGGTGEDITVMCPYNEECDLSGVTFTRNNHTLVGWATSASGERVYNKGFTLEDTNMNPGDTLDLYALWGVTYAYNNGNQYTANTGGWTYTRTFNSFVHEDGVLQAANETTSFASQYMQWSELGTYGDNVYYYGAGYFQHSTLVNMKYAKTITFRYTAPTVTPASFLGVTYYPSCTFYVLNSSGAAMASQTLTFSSAITGVTNVPLNVSGKNISSVRTRVNCNSDSDPNQQLVFRLYSVYASY